MISNSIIDWNDIDTVLLDMDGTLLDLHFDNYFWEVFLAEQYALKRNISLAQAKKFLSDHYHEKHGSLDWYNIDYWQYYLNMDIMLLKKQHSHLIGYRRDSEAFLKFLQTQGKTPALITNAHPKSLNLKLEHCALEKYIPHLFSSYDIGYAKEQNDFWPAFHKQFFFHPEKTLFIDDNETVLVAAKGYGVKHLLCVSQPDSKQAAKISKHFPSFNHFSEIMHEPKQ